LGEDPIACIRFHRELGEKRGEEAITVLLPAFPKIAIIISDGGEFRCT